jgi:hypothetical protein
MGIAAIVFVALIATAFVWPLRLFGRWLQRKARKMERGGKDATR